MKPYLELWHNQTTSWIAHDRVMPLMQSKEMARVESLYSMISCGSEKRILTHPLGEETALRMTIPYMQGDFNSSFTYGYSLVGKVVEGSNQWLGKYVHLLHPHQSAALVSTSDLFELADEVNISQATLLSNLETIINAIWDGQIEIGDKVLVMGYGIIGALLCSVLEKMIGVEIVVSEIEPLRQSLSSSKFALLRDKKAERFDKIFNTTANPKALQLGVDLLQREGTLIELSWYGNDEIPLRLGGSFHYDRKRIVSSQVSSIPNRKNNIWNFKNRKQLAMQLLQRIDFSDLMTKTIPFEDTPLFYEQLRHNKINDLGILIKY